MRSGMWHGQIGCEKTPWAAQFEQLYVRALSNVLGGWFTRPNKLADATNDDLYSNYLTIN